VFASGVLSGFGIFAGGIFVGIMTVEEGAEVTVAGNGVVAATVFVVGAGGTAMLIIFSDNCEPLGNDWAACGVVLFAKILDVLAAEFGGVVRGEIIVPVTVIIGKGDDGAGDILPELLVV
jgi:hypothetical protein